jgi:CRISPR-associated endonuclease/helicase Cas3
MFLRLQHYFRDQLGLTTQVKLIHGQAFLQEDDWPITPLSGEKDSFAALEWFGPKKRALLAPFGVGTVDQAELGALNVRHTALRLVGLAGKVLILDEVHAYDTYMTSIIERLLNWLSALGTSIILLSATLPCSRRLALARAYYGEQEADEMEFSAYPSLWIVSQTGKYLSNPPAQQASRQIQLDWLNMDDEDCQAKAEWLLKAVEEGGCACWIANTVERAQKIFECVDRMAQENIDRQLLHARFPLIDRQKLEQRLAQNYGPDGNRPVRGIVIGTQVLEQSLDLDFDVMVSDLAPVDLLLQRAGRLHRHAYHARPSAHRLPHLYINASLDAAGGLDLGVDRWIYPDFLLQKTFQILTGLLFLDLPSGYRSLVEAVYDAPPPAKSEPLGEAWQKLQEKEDKALQEAQLRLLPPPDAEDSFCGAAAARTVFEENENSAAWIVAQTRLGEESITVIPLERKDNQVFIPGSVETMDINQPVPRNMQLHLLRCSLRVSHTAVVQALRASRENLPGMFTSSPLLKDCLPLWLSNGQASFPARNGFLKLNLDARLGLVISKEGG